MKRYWLDSGIASDFVNARGPVRSRVMQAARAGDRIGIATPVLAELVGGVMASHNPPKHLQWPRQEIAGLRLWTFDANAAFEYGRLYALLRSVGRLMGAVPRKLMSLLQRQKNGGKKIKPDSLASMFLSAELEFTLQRVPAARSP